MRKTVTVAFLILVGAAALEAQHQWEWQLHGVGTVVLGNRASGSDGGDYFLGVGGGAAFRNAGRLRGGTMVSVGDLHGTPAVRGEMALTFYLNPFKRTGLTPYGGGGMAAVFSRGGSSEYVLVLLGVEANPAAAAGWFVEGGVGGGVRLAAGLRKRWGRGAR